MFIEDRLEKLKNDPKFDKHVITENAKAQWKNLSDKKKLVWINWALEEESKYLVRTVPAPKKLYFFGSQC